MIYIEILAENAISFLTAISGAILLVYTRETYLLRKESQKQTQTEFTPYLSLRNMDKGAMFSNLGKGVMLHVQVDSDSILLIPSIGSGEERQIYHMSQNRDGAFGMIANQLPDKVSVTYFDIMGNEYKALFSREYPGFGVFKEVSQSLVKQTLEKGHLKLNLGD